MWIVINSLCFWDLVIAFNFNGRIFTRMCAFNIHCHRPHSDQSYDNCKKISRRWSNWLKCYCLWRLVSADFNENGITGFSCQRLIAELFGRDFIFWFWTFLPSHHRTKCRHPPRKKLIDWTWLRQNMLASVWNLRTTSINCACKDREHCTWCSLIWWLISSRQQRK